MPPTVALPTLIRNLTTVAENANVVVASVTPGQPTPDRAAGAPSRRRLPTRAEDGESEDCRGVRRTPAPSAAAPAAPAGPQVQAVSLNISACGTFAQLRNYLREIESMQRVAAVSNVSISRGSCG